MKQSIKNLGGYTTAYFIKRASIGTAVILMAGVLSHNLSLAAPAIAKHKQTGLKSADRIVAIVDDDPVSDYEIIQRMKLERALGNTKSKGPKLRETILKRLIDERLQTQEAKRLKIKVTKKQVQTTITNMAKRARQTVPQIKTRLSKGGVDIKTFETQIRVTIAWNTVIRRLFSAKVSVDHKAVELKLGELKKSPAAGRKLLVLRQITLPLERGFPGMSGSRQREALQIYRGFKGCGSLKRLTSQIFNVHVSPGKPIPLQALPPQLAKILRKMRPGQLTRPSRSRDGISMIAYCSNKFLKAPEITFKQVESGLKSQQFGLLAKRHLLDLKRDAIIEYR